MFENIKAEPGSAPVRDVRTQLAIDLSKLHALENAITRALTH